MKIIARPEAMTAKTRRPDDLDMRSILSPKAVLLMTGITLETIRDKAQSGVDYLSVSRTTQAARAADICLSG